MPATIRGPGLMLSQFIGTAPPFDTLPGLARWARELGFLALQIPIHDRRVLDVEALAGRSGDAAAVGRMLADEGLVISELSAHRAGHLLALHPAYDGLAGALGGPAEAGPREAFARAQLSFAIEAAARLGVGRIATFSGGLAWPFVYPYPRPPAALYERAFAELARRWRPLLHQAADAGVDLCFELHPGQDLHDGVTFERFLDAVDGHARAKILYDPSHMLLQQMDYLGFIDRYHARIAAFHVKDAEFVPSDRAGLWGGYQDWVYRPARFRSPGDGRIDFRGVFDRLTRHGFNGWAVLEWECCLKNAADGAREGADFIRRHIIRVTDRAFDAGLTAAPEAAAIDHLLGLDP